MEDRKQCQGCELLAERLSQFEKRVDERFNSEARLRDETRDALNYRLDGMNELRAQITSERGHYVSLELHTALRDQIFRRVDLLENWRSWALGGLATVGAFLALGVAFLALFHGDAAHLASEHAAAVLRGQ